MLRTLAALTAAACAVTSAHAQSNVRPLPRSAGPSAWMHEFVDDDAAPELENVSDGTFFDLDLFASHTANADFTDASGALSTSRAGWAARLGSFDADTSAFALDLRADAAFYDLEGASNVVPGTTEPFNDLYTTALGGSVVARAGTRASVFAGVELALGGEDDASLSEALTVGGLVGARWRASNRASLSFGIAARSRLEDDAWVWPFLGFDVRVGERLRFTAEGPRARAELALNDHWILFGDAAFELRQYRLNEGGPLRSGVVRDEEIDLSLGVAWRPTDEIELRVFGGAAAWHEITVLDRNGATTSESEAEPSWFAGVSLSFGERSSPWRTRGLPSR